MGLKTLEQHDKEAGLRQHMNIDCQPDYNGIACPVCGLELYDSNPMVVLTSVPRKKAIHCNDCGYTRYRII